ncbi:MAG: thiol-disulfide oxidoreductase DCC family protein [Ekhidna sp.]
MGAIDTLEYPVVFFDGVCNLCNGSVQFIIKRDRNKRFRFASLQSTFAQNTLPKTYTDTDNLQSFVLVKDGKILTRSTAALTIALHLKGLWPLLYGFIIIPPFIRNFVYSIIAKNRYRWFGKKDHCMIPSPETKDLFLE